MLLLLKRRFGFSPHPPNISLFCINSFSTDSSSSSSSDSSTPSKPHKSVCTVCRCASNLERKHRRRVGEDSERRRLQLVRENNGCEFTAHKEPSDNLSSSDTQNGSNLVLPRRHRRSHSPTLLNYVAENEARLQIINKQTRVPGAQTSASTTELPERALLYVHRHPCTSLWLA